MTSSSRPSHKELLPLIEEIKEKVRKTDTYKRMCEKYKLEEDFIDLVPMAFDELRKI